VIGVLGRGQYAEGIRPARQHRRRAVNVTLEVPIVVTRPALTAQRPVHDLGVRDVPEEIRRRTGRPDAVRADGPEEADPAANSDRYAFARGPTLSLDSCCSSARTSDSRNRR
jgi:hypothetical protein